MHLPVGLNPHTGLPRKGQFCFCYNCFMELTAQKCVPCEAGTPPLQGDEIQSYFSQLKTSWEVIENRKIKRQFKFKNFKEAMVFVNKVAVLAEAEGHHPDIHIFYNKVTIELWTHAIGGLSPNDFIIASKVELL